MSDDVFRPQKGEMFQGNMPPGMKEAMEGQKAQEGQDARKALEAERKRQAEAAEAELTGEPRQQPVDSSDPGPQPQQVRERIMRGPEAMFAHNAKLQAALDRLEEQGVGKYETVELPSRGRFYTGDLAAGVVHIRPMTGSEEEILATPRYVRKNEAIDMIFERCIRENFDPKRLLTIDRTYLLIYLRGISYSHAYEVEVTCPDTDNKFKTTINLGELPVEYCPDDFDKGTLRDTLPKSGFDFRYRLSTGLDEQQVNAHRERRIKMLGDGAADDTLTFRTALLVEDLAGLDDEDDIQVLLENLPIDDVSYLRNVVNEPPFGVDTQVTVVSPYSANEFTLDLPLEASFFFPRFQRKKGTRKK